MRTFYRRIQLIGFGLLLLAAGACTYDVGEDGEPGDVVDDTVVGAGNERTCDFDAEVWAEITAEDIACTKNSDCCYFVNDCEATYVIVHAEDFATVRDFAPCSRSAKGTCATCVAPDVEPVCFEGRCVGQRIEPGAEDWEYGRSHCGTDEVILEVTTPQHAFSC
ncbi:MAG: hypothetical protein JRI23_11020 [Deltaproteobacteria bacterium]|jgi:hypothetical protein|nr:hypothetical protein [Deltaproteobacteria bacterium]MBW2532213.1 hypothetical protein [Deltaproteobacteria bacterium]